MTDKNYWTTIEERPDEHGGTVLEINAVDTNNDTVTSDSLLQGVTAHDAQGNSIVGTHECAGGFRQVKLICVRQRKKVVKIKAVNYGGSAEIDVPYYEGAYAVDPKFNTTVLFTKDYRMRDNVVINGIRVAVTENLTGGNTVYIGME